MKQSVSHVLYVSFLIVVCTLDPCLSTGHDSFPTASIGLRNENCTIPDSHEQVCDKYLDSPRWYVIDGGKLLNHCPSKGRCGNAFPAWMNGSFPTVEDDEIDLVACIKRNGNCCKEHINMKVKNCSGYYVYHLKPLKECTSAYCVESTLPCKAPTTTTQSTTTITTASTTQSKKTATQKIEIEDPADKWKYLIIGLCAGVAVLSAPLVYVIIRKSCQRNLKVDDTTELEQPPSYKFVIQQDHSNEQTPYKVTDVQAANIS